MTITLFKAFPDPYRVSMRVYADRLADALRALVGPTDTVRSFLPRPVHLAPRPARYWSQYVRYPWQARRAQGDVNHIVDHAYGHLVHALEATRTIVTFHDAIGFTTQSGIVRRYVLGGIRRAAAVLCDSDAGRRALLKYWAAPPERLAVIALGVHDQYFRPPREDPQARLGLARGRYLLHVGHTRTYKNIPALLHVLAILTRSRGVDVTLLRVGEGLTAAQWDLARGLGVERRIIELGLMPDARMPDAYQAADVLLFPPWDQGFALPVLEAMASGLPVVASNRGALPEVVGEAGLLADPSDHATLARHVAEILARPELRARLREAGRRRARAFTWERTARQTLAVYRQVSRAVQTRAPAS